MPLQPKAIIGRERELAAARQRLLRPDVRLLTLTVRPGVGKTRVALELAADVFDDFDDGVAFVDLAPISDADLVLMAIARALSLRDIDRRVVADVVEEFLRDRSLLLILDNFEQVLDAADGRRSTAGGLSRAEGGGHQPCATAPALGARAAGTSAGAADVGRQSRRGR